MNNSMINSMVTMRALQQKIDLVANNISHLDTNGYKRKDATFKDVLNNVVSQPQGFEKEGRLSPLGLPQGWGARLSQVQLDLSQGTLKETGVSTDVSISGGALFAIQRSITDSNGERINEQLYTRDGSFQWSVMPSDTEYRYLTTKDGWSVLNTAGEPIRVQMNEEIRIDEEGTLYAYRPSQPDSATAIGQIQLMRVIRPQYLQEMGYNKYGVAADAEIGAVLQAAAGGDDIAVKQGFLEQSNVSLSDEMTELMMIQRAFQMNSRAITSSDTMMQLTNNLRG
ncbi:flagellar hook-basal body protein [Paenibacillus senegalensis]|uniref:flagellar hook-basal body protein n=1 Tax=Paenibacillus senegalensis TaxID=1465766 RepID=UPI00028A2EC9|nr:flagellar hook-basal body protein [Paenibacillus senegalensis]